MVDFSGSRFFIRKESFTGENFLYLSNLDGVDSGDYDFFSHNPLGAVSFEDYSLAEVIAEEIDEDDLEIVKMNMTAEEVNSSFPKN